MADNIPMLLGWAVLLPLLSFVAILIAGPRMGKAGALAGWVATLAIVAAGLLSLTSLAIWAVAHPVVAEAEHGDDHEAEGDHGSEGPVRESDHARVASPREVGVVSQATGRSVGGVLAVASEEEHGPATAQPASDPGTSHDESAAGSHGHATKPYLAGDWYTLGTFGALKLTIGYYVDALTLAMFCMVTLIASCIHFYAMGYMHDELHEFTDPEVVMEDGSNLKRPGRYHRFFQFMSLFCFSMLGVVVAGNIAMTFVFWELVGICSYFLIGFYIERPSASTAANKAFIVNRIGDFGMIIGLMALWAGLGTFAYGDVGDELGMFSLVRPEATGSTLEVPQRMALLASGGDIASATDPGYWMLVVGGLGIFCGCIGKSAQFPLHTWLPDAMEGPTPVSALVHSATMVAAGVFLVARFYPVFTPEVLFVIAVIGAITLFMAATIAITATDIKRVLAYSTVSQLGFMMTALGVGGWLAGVMHLFTHAFFKSLLFLCSGSVIHAVHTNEMTEMGGLRKKMPWTAYTMLVGCLAIVGAGIPFVIGLSGYYSKDKILEQSLLFGELNRGTGQTFFVVAAGGAAITAFYMFRLWYMTFAGKPRDDERYDHAHESPPVMVRPLILLAVFAVVVAWTPQEAILGSLVAAIIFFAVHLFGGSGSADAQDHHAHEADDGAHHAEDHHADSAGQPAMPPWAVPLLWCGVVLIAGWVSLATGWDQVTLESMLEQARPAGTLEVGSGIWTRMFWPDEHASHAAAIRIPATLVAFCMGVAGILVATVFYCWKLLSADDVRQQFKRLYNFLINKWWFDELYDRTFVRPTQFVAGLVARFDLRVIDRFIDGLAASVCRLSTVWDAIVDRRIVDGTFNKLAEWTYAVGLRSRNVQTGRLRQYVMFIVLGIVAIFVLASFFWGYAFAG